jgi:hypothetical protein
LIANKEKLQLPVQPRTREVSVIRFLVFLDLVLLSNYSFVFPLIYDLENHFLIFMVFKKFKLSAV